MFWENDNCQHWPNSTFQQNRHNSKTRFIMSWPTLFSSSSPASSWNGRRAAVVTITALCGIGCIAYMLLLRRSHGKRRKKKSRKAKWNDLSQLESNVILQLQKSKFFYNLHLFTLPYLCCTLLLCSSVCVSVFEIRSMITANQFLNTFDVYV